MRSSPVLTIVLMATIVLLDGLAVSARTRSRTASLRVAGSIAGSIVLVDDVRLGRTDSKGSGSFANIPPGRRTALVRQPGFADDRRIVSFAAGAVATIKPKRLAISDNAERLQRAALFLAADGKHEQAAAEFRRAIEARGGPYREAEVGLARSLLALKDYDGASAAAESLAAANPKNLEAQTVLANVLRERGFYDEAAEAYRRAVALSPDRAPEAHAGLAILLGERGDLSGAATEYKLAIAQNFDAEPILYQLYGGVLERLDRPSEAVTSYERFLALAPSSSLAPAVRSVVEQLKKGEDVNPYAPAP
ncbi:MAG: tetratricopeptide repeat protein [Blastocatellia bacterium]|jgi:tetratricopeptide (TPR) repeat protein|nr:tetratricopeptide repeat protein [Blastocatellia bacterium]MBK6428492.1 tetratricopeptide repeat protein [Blastocatellia bacterium]